MYEDDNFMYHMKMSCNMALDTIRDIHESSGGHALTSNELDDLHHCLEILKDTYITKEMHKSWMDSQAAARCMSKSHE